MGLIDIASGNSVWRGIDYCENKKVIKILKCTENEYDSLVQGAEQKTYNVHLNIAHPRKSTCDCPHANGRRVICKHLVATYYTLFPEEMKQFLKEAEEYEKEEEAREQEEIERIEKYVKSLNKQELQAMLINYMIEEWYMRDGRYW